MSDHKISLYENSSQYVNAAIDRIVVEIFNKRKPDAEKAQIILLTGASPLVGTTSAAIDLSIAAAATGRRILLIDCDVRKAEKYKKLSEDTAVGLSDYLLQDSKLTINPENIIYDTNVENLQCIPCGSYADNPTRVMCSSRMNPFLQKLKEEFDYIICDLPSINIVPDAQVLFQAADGIILLAALGETRKSSLREAKKKIEPFACKYYGMIINKISPDIYRKRVRNYDYYLPDQKGNQKLGRSTARKQYEKRKKAEERAEKKAEKKMEENAK